MMRNVLTGRRRIALAVVIVVGLLVLLGAHAAQLTCGFDPTDDCNWSVFVVSNDSPSAVALRQCLHHCGQGDRRLDPIYVAAGQGSPPRQYGSVYATTGGLAWWEVTDASTQRQLGCLVLDGRGDKTDGKVLLVSRAHPCRATQPPTPPVGRTQVQSP